MSVVSLPDILDPAFEQRYGVVAFNAVDDVTMDGLIRAADAARSPLIIQTSVSPAKFLGEGVLVAVYREIAAAAPIPRPAPVTRMTRSLSSSGRAE